MSNAEVVGNYYRVKPDMRDLNYGKFVEEGIRSISEQKDYTSHNTDRLDEELTKKMLLDLPFIQKALTGEFSEPLE
jgi:UDP-glucose 4-epimerase